MIRSVFVHGNISEINERFTSSAGRFTNREKVELSCSMSSTDQVPKSEISPSQTNTPKPAIDNLAKQFDEQGKHSLTSKVPSFIAGSLVGGGTAVVGLSFAMAGWGQNVMLTNSLFFTCSTAATILSGMATVKFAENEIFQKSWKFGALLGICAGALDPMAGVFSAYASGALMAIALKVKKPKADVEKSESHV